MPIYDHLRSLFSNFSTDSATLDALPTYHPVSRDLLKDLNFEQENRKKVKIGKVIGIT